MVIGHQSLTRCALLDSIVEHEMTCLKYTLGKPTGFLSHYVLQHFGQLVIVHKYLPTLRAKYQTERSTYSITKYSNEYCQAIFNSRRINHH